MSIRIIIIFFILCFFSSLFAQEEKKIDTLSIKNTKSTLAVLPVLAYSPETNFIVGGIGAYFFHFNKDDILSRHSEVDLYVIYTTKNQLTTGTKWNLFTRHENYNIVGQLEYSKWSERFYGIGNQSDFSIIQFDKDSDRGSTLNYLDHFINYLTFNTTFTKKLSPGFFMGLKYDFERAEQFKYVRDSVVFIANEEQFDLSRIESHRSGVGLFASYDTRQYNNNPIDATYIRFENIYYNKLLGSPSNYVLLGLDARKYINVHKDQIFAARFVAQQRYSRNREDIPLRGLAFIGGRDFIRGYFQGTFRDNHALALELEYRLPLWQDLSAPGWKFWKRMGVVGFVSGANVYSRWQYLDIEDTKLAVGAGLRVMLNVEHRINVRIDYGIGLDEAAGNGIRPAGIYFYVGEAF